MPPMKGDFQMSLGLIIAVVFSVVLLSLAIVWLQGIIGDITGLTKDLTLEAQSKLRETFRSTTSSFAVYPSFYNLENDHGLRMSAGIENSDPLARNLFFIINVKPASADNTILAAKGCTTFATCPAISADMRLWSVFSAGAIPAKYGETTFLPIEIHPRNAVKGTYIYNVFSCFGTTAPTFVCDETTSPDRLWGSVQQILITLV